MLYEEVPKRIIKMNQDIKLIFILRNPVDRAYSHYWHSVREGNETLSFEEAIKKEEERIKKSDFAFRAYSYVTRGLYYKQINNFLRAFSKEQMLFLLTKELSENRFKLLKKIYNFLEVNSNFIPSNINQKKNSSKIIRSVMLHKFIYSDYKLKKVIKNLIPKKLRKKIIKIIKKTNVKSGNYPEMKPKTRKKLSKKFVTENKKLSKLLDKDLTHWNYN